MNIITVEELNSSYYIYEDLTSNKPYKTQVAFINNPNIMAPIILKEMDEKRACVYQALANMWNPYIANVYSIYKLKNSNSSGQDTISDKYIAITENVGSMSLKDYVHEQGPLSIKNALTICVQLCDGLSEFHKAGFIHRDIKPDNIMMSCCDPNNLSVKIIDFGGAKEIHNDKNSDTTVIGTLGYQAPESLSAATRNTADIFSIGCVLNFLLTGQEPGIKKYTEKNNVITIIEKATHIDPSSRYSSVEELKKYLQHELRTSSLDKIPFFRSIPGFRTHTYWKMLLASITYISFIYVIIIQCLQGLYLASMEMLFFYFFIPLVMICNLGNLLRFVPYSIRSSSKKFFLLRLTVVLVSFWMPIILENYLR